MHVTSNAEAVRQAARIKAELAKFGTKSITEGTDPTSLLIDIRAETKCGTTRFGVRVPKRNGVLYVNTDRDLRHVRALKKMLAGGEIQQLKVTGWSRNTGADAQEKARALRDKISGAVRTAVKLGVSTVVVDKATDIHALLAYAEWGAPEKVLKAKGGKMYKDQAPLDRWWLNFFQHFKDSEATNLVLIHRMGEKYWKDKPTGKSKSKGWSDVSYHSTLSLEMWKDMLKTDHEGADKFGATIVESTYLHSLEGEELRGREISFAGIAAKVCPNTPAEHWL